MGSTSGFMWKYTDADIRCIQAERGLSMYVTRERENWLKMLFKKFWVERWLLKYTLKKELS